jgi:hypothetical protein
MESTLFAGLCVLALTTLSCAETKTAQTMTAPPVEIKAEAKIETCVTSSVTADYAANHETTSDPWLRD